MEPLSFQIKKAEVHETFKSVTSGRGADVVIEVIGLSAALRTAFDLLRPWGIITNISVHNGEVVFSQQCPVESANPPDRQ